MINLKSTDNLAALENQWLEAKTAERGWNEHRLLIEGRTLELIPQETHVTVLPAKGQIRLDKLNIGFGQTRTFNQTKLAALIADYPWLLQVLFKIEYKCTSNPQLDAFIAEGDDEGVGERLKDCFEDKDKKPSFSAR